jgi:site-specific DNA-cytosine methylase
MGRGAGLKGERSGLFFQALRIFKETRPRYWIFENVASMPLNQKNEISQLLGVEPIMINSALVSAQTRKRLYWTNIHGVEQPKDKGIKLQSILTSGFSDRDKAHALLTNQLPETEKGLTRYLTKSTGQIAFREEYYAGFDKDSKLRRYKVMKKASESFGFNPDFERNNVFRHLNVNECEALQTLHKDYTAGISDSQRFKCLGNSFTCDVIVHILEPIKELFT